MDAERFVVVIGSGAAGGSCARRLARAGVSVAVIEDDKVGGTCLWRGCMPKKALYNAASALLDGAKSESFGITCDERSFDWPSVLAWKWHAQETYAGDQEAAFAEQGVRLIHGTARFSARLRLEVHGETLNPTEIVIACGSQPARPNIPGAEEADTSEQALHYPEVPESLAIVGAGYVAFEFAAIYTAFGTKVTILARGDRLLSDFDAELVAIARRRLEELGVRFRTGAAIVRIDDAGVALESGELVAAERVLLATGRTPRAGALDPAVGSLDLDDVGRLLLDDHLRTSDPRVFAAGDAAGGGMHTPLANLEGRYVADSILGGEDRPVDLAVIPTAVFTFPQLAQVGLSEEAARAANLAYTVRRQSFGALGAPIISDDREGLVKLVLGEDGTLLGAHIAGRDASDLIYPYAVAIRAGGRLDDVRTTPAIHPAYTQVVEWAAW